MSDHANGVRAAFLDRDGVINIDKAYIYRWEDFIFAPGALKAIGQLSRAGYRIVVITNQSGIARGYYTEAQYQELTRHLAQTLREHGADLIGIYHCPHHPKGSVSQLAVECCCRKPKPGLLLQAAREHGLDLANSLMVGDKPSDIQAARAAGVGRAYLVHSDNSESVDEIQACLSADGLFRNLADCVNQVLVPR